jgi:hypothetical protein
VTSRYEFFIPSLPDRVCGDDHQQSPIPVGLYDNLPPPAAVSRLDDPPSFDDVSAVAGRSLQHPPEIDLGETTIRHPLEEMRAEIEFPFPPFGAPATPRPRSPLISVAAVPSSLTVFSIDSMTSTR